MESLSEVLEQTLQYYAGKGANGYSYFLKNDVEHTMTIVAKFLVKDKTYVDTSILARIVGEKIIIEDDKTNKPLVDALVQAGIPREQIILVYAGEKAEETA